MPHAHYLARKWEVFAVEPENRKAETLLKITDWDFHWKQNFEYKQSKLLKKGTVIHALAEYDNTAENLANPSEPPRAMDWGKRMYEELFLVYFSFAPHSEQNRGKPFFTILPGATNITQNKVEVGFNTQKTASFSCTLLNFEGKEVLSVFENQAFKKGDHFFPVDLANLKKGNYYFELESNELVHRRIFVYLDETIFD